MKKKFYLMTLLIIVSFLLSAFSVPAQAQSTPEDLAVLINGENIEWQTGWDSPWIQLSITQPGGEILVYDFYQGKTPSFVYTGLADGLYQFELVGFPSDELTVSELDEESQNGRSYTFVGMNETDINRWQGRFQILKGAVTLPSSEDGFDQDINETKDQVFLDDMIVDGSLCVGFDCVNGESFGFDTFRLKENNLRINFQDTSNSSGFPTRDWRIVINDTISGGAEYFAIEDSDAGRKPFIVEAGASANALLIEGDGDIGFGTANPAVKLHMIDGDTPAVRLDQQGGGWTPQVWDIAGNETNFFIRDTTNGSRLVFRIRTGAPQNSLYIAADGKVGLGTQSPQALLDVQGDAMIKGDLVLEGYISERSDVNAKENFAVVNNADILSKVADLPISTWNYKDDSLTQHIGPMAQDFYGAFSVGKDNTHLSALDVNGVALASIQELNRLVTEKDAKIADLESRVNALENQSTNSPVNLILPFVFGLGGMFLGAFVISRKK